MKKILASILALAMIFVFVSCDPVAGPAVDNSGVENPIEKPDVNDGKEKDETEKEDSKEEEKNETEKENNKNEENESIIPIGEDPLKGVKKLISDNYSYNEVYYIVDTTKRTITQEVNEKVYEFSYTYKVDEEKTLLSMSTSAVYIDGIRYNAEEFVDYSVSIYFPEEDLQELIKAVKAGDEEAILEANDFLKGIDGIFILEEVTAENVETVFSKAKEKLNEQIYNDFVKKMTYEIAYLRETEDEGVYGIYAEGYYDESKEWYNQENGKFYANDYGETWLAEYYISDNYVFCYQTREYGDTVEESKYKAKILGGTDSKIIFENDDGERVQGQYTKTGVGKAAIYTININGEEMIFSWVPKTF